MAKRDHVTTQNNRDYRIEQSGDKFQVNNSGGGNRNVGTYSSKSDAHDAIKSDSGFDIKSSR